MDQSSFWEDNIHSVSQDFFFLGGGGCVESQG
jgi:hypothetical protein